MVDRVLAYKPGGYGFESRPWYITPLYFKYCLAYVALYPHVCIYMYILGLVFGVIGGFIQLSCLGGSVGRALCLEYRVSWVRVPPEAANFF